MTEATTLPELSTLDPASAADRQAASAIADRPRDQAPAQPLTFALIADIASFKALRLEWDALFARSGKPAQVFQSFDWLWVWTRHYLDPNMTLSIVTGRRAGRLALVLPMVSTRRAGFRTLSFMGDPLSQYGDALIDAEGDAEALADQAIAFVKALPADVVWLRRVREDAAIAGALVRGAKRTSDHTQAPYVDFSGARDISALEQRLSSKFRSGRRRHLRRLNEFGPIAFECHGPGPRARELAQIALAFKNEWVRKGGRFAPTVVDPRFGRFFVEAAAGGDGLPPLRVSAMLCGGEPIGVEISVVCKGWLFGHVLAPRPGLEKQGAGGVLAGHSIASGLEQGYRAYDLLAPADAYKMEWASGSVEVRDFATSRTLLGLLYQRAWLDFGRAFARTQIKQWLPRIRRLLDGAAPAALER